MHFIQLPSLARINYAFDLARDAGLIAGSAARPSCKFDNCCSNIEFSNIISMRFGLLLLYLMRMRLACDILKFRIKWSSLLELYDA